MKRAHSFKRKGPDLITLQLASVLSAESWFDFQELFGIVFSDLRSRGSAGGGEEMLRLRTYEKLQNLVQAGNVEKKGKTYKGVPAGLNAIKEHVAAEHCRDLLNVIKAGSPLADS